MVNIKLLLRVDFMYINENNVNVVKYDGDTTLSHIEENANIIVFNGSLIVEGNINKNAQVTLSSLETQNPPKFTAFRAPNITLGDVKINNRITASGCVTQFSDNQYEISRIISSRSGNSSTMMSFSSNKTSKASVTIDGIKYEGNKIIIDHNNVYIDDKLINLQKTFLVKGSILDGVTIKSDALLQVQGEIDNSCNLKDCYVAPNLPVINQPLPIKRSSESVLVQPKEDKVIRVQQKDLDQVFLIAAQEGDYDACKQYMEENNDLSNRIADIKDPQYEGNALHWAAFNGHFSIVKLLLKNYPHIRDSKTKNGSTALKKAIMSNHYQIVEYFLAEKANYNIKDLIDNQTNESIKNLLSRDHSNKIRQEAIIKSQNLVNNFEKNKQFSANQTKHTSLSRALNNNAIPTTNQNTNILPIDCDDKIINYVGDTILDLVEENARIAVKDGSLTVKGSIGKGASIVLFSSSKLTDFSNITGFIAATDEKINPRIRFTGCLSKLSNTKFKIVPGSQASGLFFGSVNFNNYDPTVSITIDGTKYVGKEIIIDNDRVSIDNKTISLQQKLIVNGSILDNVNIKSEGFINVKGNIGSACFLESDSYINGKIIGDKTKILARLRIDVRDVGKEGVLHSKESGIRGENVSEQVTIKAKKLVSLKNVGDRCDVTVEQDGFQANNIGQYGKFDINDDMSVDDISSFTVILSRKGLVNAVNLGNNVEITAYNDINIDGKCPPDAKLNSIAGKRNIAPQENQAISENVQQENLSPQIMPEVPNIEITQKSNSTDPREEIQDKFFEAVKCNNINDARYWISKGAWINKRMNVSEIHIMEEIIAKRLGMSSSEVKNYKCTAFYYACLKGYLEMAKMLLLEAKADHCEYESNDSLYGCYPIHVVAYFGYLEILQYLINTLKLTDSKNNTALHYAVYGNQPEVVKYLLWIKEYHKNPPEGVYEMNQPNDENLTAFNIAKNKHNSQIVDIFKNRYKENELKPLFVKLQESTSQILNLVSTENSSNMCCDNNSILSQPPLQEIDNAAVFKETFSKTKEDSNSKSEEKPDDFTFSGLPNPER